MRIAIGSDHAGFGYKAAFVEWLSSRDHQVLDIGTQTREPVDYPDVARAVAEAVAAGEAERGVLVCGSAVGVSVVANKIPGIRAGVCHDTYSAHQAVEHDDVNVLCLGERVIGLELAREILERFMEARFSGEPRHRRRLDKLAAVERSYLARPPSSADED